MTESAREILLKEVAFKNAIENFPEDYPILYQFDFVEDLMYPIRLGNMVSKHVMNFNEEVHGYTASCDYFVDRYVIPSEQEEMESRFSIKHIGNILSSKRSVEFVFHRKNESGIVEAVKILYKAIGGETKVRYALMGLKPLAEVKPGELVLNI